MAKAKRTAKTKKKASASKKSSRKTSKKTTQKKSKRAPKKKASSKRKKASTSPLGLGNQHVDFLTYKSAQVQKFYGELLELKTEFRDVDGLAYLVVKTSSNSSIGFMPPHPEMRGEQPAPKEPSLYFKVRDIDRAYRYLVGKGVAFVKPPELMPWGDRVVTTTDPEGRTIIIAGKAESEE